MIHQATHRHVVTVDGRHLAYVCGCVNEVDPECGALRSVSKCDDHLRERSEAAELGEAYYRSNGALDRDAPARYSAELTEALGAVPSPRWPHLEALEIGCGASPYAMALQRAGWSYRGLDTSAWARRWLKARYGVCTVAADFEAWEPDCQPGLILAAHVFEHMVDAPAAIRKCAEILAPGGEMWLIVPNDDDPLNPDHLWTFDEQSLRTVVTAAGLRAVTLSTFQRIERERFLYLRAIKPQ